MSKQKQYKPHAYHLKPHQLAARLAQVWLRKQRKRHLWLEIYNPRYIPQIAEAVCRDLFRFDYADLGDTERNCVWCAILDAQASLDEKQIVEETCMALLFVAEHNGWRASLANGAQETLG